MWIDTYDLHVPSERLKEWVVFAYTLYLMSITGLTPFFFQDTAGFNIQYVHFMFYVHK